MKLKIKILDLKKTFSSAPLINVLLLIDVIIDHAH